MITDTDTPPKYDPEIVARVILIEIIEQHPLRLTVDELALRIVRDPDDGDEFETATNAVRDLRRAGVVRYRNDDRLVGPTQAAMRTYELLTEV